MDSPDEGDDPRDALDMAYQRRLRDLADARAALADAVARRGRLERDLADAGDDQDVSVLHAQVNDAIAHEHELAAKAGAIHARADAYRAERDRVLALRDAGNARAAARGALRHLRAEDG